MLAPERYRENYKNVSQDIRDQLNAEAEAVQIILTGKDNDIYSTVDACPNACEIKHQNEVNEIRVERLAHYANPIVLVAQLQHLHSSKHPTQKHSIFLTPGSQQYTKKRGKAIVTSSAPTYDPKSLYWLSEDQEMSKEKEIDKLMALISLSFKKIYKPTNNNLRTSSNTSRANQDNSPRINRGTGYDNQRAVNVAGARENVGTPVVQKSGIQCYNCKEYGHVSRESDWKDDTDDESEEQELEAHYMYMAQIQEVTPDPVDNSGPIFDDEPMHKVQNNNDNYNVFAMENEHPEQPESSNDIYLAEQGDTNITIDSSDICYDRAQDDQDETDDLDQERDLLASLIQKLKCEIDDSKNRNKFLESSNKELVDKLKGEIEDFKTKNKSLESSNNHFKEANNELSKTNQLMFKDLKKFQAKLDKSTSIEHSNSNASNSNSKVPTVTAPLTNIIQAESNTELHIDDDEFIKHLQLHRVQEKGATSSCHVDSANYDTFYQHPSFRTSFGQKDHPIRTSSLERNLLQSVTNKTQLETDGEMCLFALTVSSGTEPKEHQRSHGLILLGLNQCRKNVHQFDFELMYGKLSRQDTLQKWS
ncbi:ribonuclease H-like domain-containing protein [Tanacetum coccineum]